MRISIPCDEIRGLDASLRGDSYVDLLLQSRIRLGVPRERGSSPGHVWAYPWSSLTPLLEGSCRTLVEGQFPLPRGSYRARSPFPRCSGNIRLWILPPPVCRACLFRRGSGIGVVVGDVV
jgi:hypothetical protein